MAEVRELLDKSETAARIQFYKETMSPALKRAGLANEKELAAYPDLLSYGSKIADELWQQILRIYRKVVDWESARLI
jgi:hypothetical protein